MKAAVLDAFGRTPRCGEFEEPVAQDGEAIVEVVAASIKQLDRAIAAGKHYSSPRALPVVCGTDGVGRLADGTRVYFAATRRPFGAMAERAPASWSVPLPDGLDAGLAAAIVNPALAARLPWSGGSGCALARLSSCLARPARPVAWRRERPCLLGAGRVIVAGRRQDVLNALDADATINLRLPAEEAQTGLRRGGEPRPRNCHRLRLGRGRRGADRRIGQVGFPPMSPMAKAFASCRWERWRRRRSRFLPPRCAARASPFSGAAPRTILRTPKCGRSLRIFCRERPEAN